MSGQTMPVPYTLFVVCNSSRDAARCTFTTPTGRVAKACVIERACDGWSAHSCHVFLHQTLVPQQESPSRSLRKRDAQRSGKQPRSAAAERGRAGWGAYASRRAAESTPRGTKGLPAQPARRAAPVPPALSRCGRAGARRPRGKQSQLPAYGAVACLVTPELPCARARARGAHRCGRREERSDGHQGRPRARHGKPGRTAAGCCQSLRQNSARAHRARAPSSHGKSLPQRAQQTR